MLSRIAVFSTLAALSSGLQRGEETKGLRGVQIHESLSGQRSGTVILTHLDRVVANRTKAPDVYREWHKRWSHQPSEPKTATKREYRKGWHDYKAEYPRAPLAPNTIDRNAESTAYWYFALATFGIVVSCIGVYYRMDGYAEWAQAIALGAVAAVPAGLFVIYMIVVAIVHFDNAVRPTVAYPDERWQCGSMTWYLLFFPITSLLCLVLVPLWFVPSALTDPEDGKVRNLGLIGKMVPADWFMAILLLTEAFLFFYGVYLVFGTGPNQTFCEPEVWWSSALLAGFSSVLMVSAFLAGCVWYSFQSLSEIPWARDFLHSLSGCEERIAPAKPLVPSLGRRPMLPYSKRAMMMSATGQEQRPAVPATLGPSEFPRPMQPQAVVMSATFQQRPAVPATLGASEFPVQPIFLPNPTPPSAARVDTPVVPPLALPQREASKGFAAPFAVPAPVASPPLSPAPAQRWPSTGFEAPFANKQLAKPEAFSVGDKVQAQYLNGRWYGATVEEVRSDGTHLISWDDGASGDREKPREKLRFAKPWNSDGAFQSTEAGMSRRSELQSGMEAMASSNRAGQSQSTVRKPKVGDFVRVARPRPDKDSHLQYSGLVGKIITDDGSQQPYQIEGMEGVTEKGTVWFFEDEIDIVQAADSSQVTYPASARLAPQTAPDQLSAISSKTPQTAPVQLSATTLKAAAEHASQAPGLSAATLEAAAQWRSEASQSSQPASRQASGRRQPGRPGASMPSMPTVPEGTPRAAPKVRPGDRVKAKYRSQVTGTLTDIFFEGEVLAVNPTGTVDIKYSDGAKCQNIPPEAVQLRNDDI